MRIAEVMSREVEFLAPDASVQEAAVMMGELEVGALPVGAGGEIQGVVTDRDILYRVVANGRDPAATRVGEIMSQPVIACAAEDTVQAAMDLMAAHYIRRLAVRDPAGRIAGWVTLNDLSRRLLLDSEALQGALHDITDPPAAPA